MATRICLLSNFFSPTWKASIFLLILWFIELVYFQKTIVCPPTCCIVLSHVHSQRGTIVTKYNGLFSRWVWNQLIQTNESCRKIYYLQHLRRALALSTKQRSHQIKCGSFILESHTYSYVQFKVMYHGLKRKYGRHETSRHLFVFRILRAALPLSDLDYFLRGFSYEFSGRPKSKNNFESELKVFYGAVDFSF